MTEEKSVKDGSIKSLKYSSSIGEEASAQKPSVKNTSTEKSAEAQSESSGESMEDIQRYLFSGTTQDANSKTQNDVSKEIVNENDAIKDKTENKYRGGDGNIVSNSVFEENAQAKEKVVSKSKEVNEKELTNCNRKENVQAKKDDKIESSKTRENELTKPAKESTDLITNKDKSNSLPESNNVTSIEKPGDKDRLGTNKMDKIESDVSNKIKFPVNESEANEIPEETAPQITKHKLSTEKATLEEIPSVQPEQIKTKTKDLNQESSRSREVAKSQSQAEPSQVAIKQEDGGLPVQVRFLFIFTILFSCNACDE